MAPVTSADAATTGPDPEFRVAGPDDIDALGTLVHAAYRGDESREGWTHEADLLDGQRTDDEALRDLLHAPASIVLLAELLTDGPERELVGCCHLSARPPAGAYLGMFAVRPRHQGGGLGRAILGRAEAIARERWGARRVEMTVIRQRHDLVAWYEHLGYRPTGATEPFPYGDERFGLPRRPDLEFVVLAKELGPLPAD